jgi:transcriptional regulator with XRE-family HTH domain
MINVGQNIRRIREFKNLTQEHVADKSGLSVSTYGSIERGEADVNFRKLADIAEALGVKEEEIIMMSTEVNIHSIHDNISVLVSNKGTAHFTGNEKELMELMLKEKNEEIAFLRGLVKKGETI